MFTDWESSFEGHSESVEMLGAAVENSQTQKSQGYPHQDWLSFQN